MNKEQETPILELNWDTHTETITNISYSVETSEGVFTIEVVAENIGRMNEYRIFLNDEYIRTYVIRSNVENGVEYAKQYVEEQLLKELIWEKTKPKPDFRILYLPTKPNNNETN